MKDEPNFAKYKKPTIPLISGITIDSHGETNLDVDTTIYPTNVIITHRGIDWWQQISMLNQE